jgi:hypothetical protein
MTASTIKDHPIIIMAAMMANMCWNITHVTTHSVSLEISRGLLLTAQFKLLPNFLKAIMHCKVVSKFTLLEYNMGIFMS